VKKILYILLFICVFHDAYNQEYILLKKIIKTSDLGLPITKEENWSGTGFAISTKGYVLTNFHVTEGADLIEIKGVNGDFINKFKAKVIVNDVINDLSIIKIIDEKFSKIYQIPYNFKYQIAEVGEDVFTLGYPLISSMGDNIKLTDGIISATSGINDDITKYQITNPIQPGNSGGPLFDKNGNVIGVVNSKYVDAENVGYAIKINYINNLLDQIGLPKLTNNQSTLKNVNLPSKTKILKNFVYQILVKRKTNEFVENNILAKDYMYLGIVKINKAFSSNGIFIDRNSFVEGLEMVRKSSEMEPLGVEKLNEVGKKLFGQKLYKEAVAIFELGANNAESKTYLDDNLYLGLSLYYANNKKDVKPEVAGLQKADAAFDKVLVASPSYYEAYIFKARTNSLMENDENTIKFYEAYVAAVTAKGAEETAKPAVIKKIAESYNTIGAIYANTDKVKAVEYFNKTLVIDPTNAYALSSIKQLK
jgi:tetratricopeptide (TPR) repeat protein